MTSKELGISPPRQPVSARAAIEPLPPDPYDAPIELQKALRVCRSAVVLVVAASFRAIATFAIFRPRRMARWKNWLRHCGGLRTVTWAASTSRNRSNELPRLLMCPSRLRSALDSSAGTSPT
jgi:hypothetical protein